MTKRGVLAMAASAIVMWTPARACGASEFSELGLGDPSPSPCLAQRIDKLKSDVFLYASNPADLWKLVSVATCSHGLVEDDQREIENFIASPIPYVAENFPSEQGPLDRTEVVTSPDEVAQLVVSSALYASCVEIFISRSDRAVLKVSNEVCTLQLDLHKSGGDWSIQRARNQCD